MKADSYQYYPVKLMQAATQLEFTQLTDFCAFADSHHLNHIFLLMNEQNEHTHFALSVHNTFIQFPTAGYYAIADYLTAQKNGFPDAGIYYEALTAGYKIYSDYTLVKEAGISDPKIFDAVKQKGFITGYHGLLEEPKMLIDIAVITNPYLLYTDALKHGFEDYAGFKAALDKGFADASTYNIATELGFPTFADYTDAIQKGFRTYTDLQSANEKQIINALDYRNYIDLEYLLKENETHDQRVLLILLSKLEQGKRISINKLFTLLQTTLEEYKYAETNQMPLWFTYSENTIESVIHFLLHNTQIKKYGAYDNDGEFFEVNKMQDRKVILDGSNVAHNSNGSLENKPTVANLIIMVDFLKAQGFQDISVIADASLRHRLIDNNKLEILKQKAIYLEAPRENPADTFIIQYVKSQHCLLISNDTFREWKVQDPWVAENIDFYRLSFMIKGNEVLMPDLK